MREWSPYGVPLSAKGEVAGVQDGLGYTGEWFDLDVELQYLRARWLNDMSGRFLSPDPARPHLASPITTHEYAYGLNNPVRYVDPSGLSALADDEQEHLLRFRAAYHESASRHNRLHPQMDDNGFAALIAATVLDENIVDPLTGADTAQFWLERRIVGMGGCIVSGHYLKAACADSMNTEQCLAYLANELPTGHPLWTLPSVGIGNIKLYAAANLWQGRACRVVWDEGKQQFVEECLQTPVRQLQRSRHFLWFTSATNLHNPFAESCNSGVCEYTPEKAIESY